MDFSTISGVTDYTNSLASATNTDKLTDKVKNAQSDEELLDACKEFETYLWEQVVKSMKNTTTLLGGDSSNSQIVDYFMDTAITDVSEKLTEQNLGPGSLAQQMYEQMKRTSRMDAKTLFEQAGKQQEELDAAQEESGTKL